MRVPKEYPGPDQVKAILAWAKITGMRTKDKWIEHYAQQSDEYQMEHYWQLRAALVFFVGVDLGDHIMEAEL